MAVGHQGAPPHRQEPRNETEEELPRLRAKGRGETSSASDPTVLSPPTPHPHPTSHPGCPAPSLRQPSFPARRARSCGASPAPTPLPRPPLLATPACSESELARSCSPDMILKDFPLSLPRDKAPVSLFVCIYRTNM